MFEVDMNYRPIGWPFIYHFDHRRPSWSTIHPHWHVNIEILLITHGSGSIICDGESFDVKAGDIFVLNSECIHSIYSPTEMKYHCMMIDADFCRQMGLPFDERRIAETVTDPTANALYENIVTQFSEKPPYNRQHAMKNALELLLYLYKNYSMERSMYKRMINNASSTSMDYIKRALEYIRVNLNSKLTLEDIAKSVGISKHHLCREFKKYTGETIVFYINARKMRRANHLLLQGHPTVNVACYIGYGNMSYFAQLYKKHIGESPSDTAKKAPTKRN